MKRAFFYCLIALGYHGVRRSDSEDCGIDKIRGEVILFREQNTNDHQVDFVGLVLYRMASDRNCKYHKASILEEPQWHSVL